MPAKSKAQLKLAYAVLAGKSTKMPTSVASEMVHKTKRVKGLPRKK